jgi:hypothetical protein
MFYPVKNPADWSKVGRLSFIKKLKAKKRSKRLELEAKKWTGLSLSPIRRLAKSLSASDVVLLCVTRNTSGFIHSFLEHYRRLGITRFAFVDDHSNDGTREILLNATDVDTFESNFTFRQCDGGLIWRDMLVDLYGRDRWYISVDSDEYLIYPGCENRPISDFISDVERTGRKRALAAMIDLYNNGPLGATEPHVPPNAPPTNFCPLFDGDGYRLTNETQCTAVHGGPRKRMFGADMLLTKFPLLFADRETRFNGGSHHAPLPIQRNFAPVHAVLLHYKFPAGAIDGFHAIVDRQSHARGSHWYKAIIDSNRFDETTDLRYVHSQSFAGSETLVAGGYMQDLRKTARGTMGDPR